MLYLPHLQLGFVVRSLPAFECQQQAHGLGIFMHTVYQLIQRLRRGLRQLVSNAHRGLCLTGQGQGQAVAGVYGGVHCCASAMRSCTHCKTAVSGQATMRPVSRSGFGNRPSAII